MHNDLLAGVGLEPTSLSAQGYGPCNLPLVIPSYKFLSGVVGLEPTKSLDQNQLPLPFRPHTNILFIFTIISPSWI